MFGLLNLISGNRLCASISIKREVRRVRIFNAHVKTRQLQTVQLTCQSQASLQSPAIKSTDKHFNFGAPKFPEMYTYACNDHSSVHCKVTSHYAFIPL